MLESNFSSSGSNQGNQSGNAPKRMYFDEYGDPPARYDIMNYQRHEDGTYSYQRIGEWSTELQTTQGTGIRVTEDVQFYNGLTGNNISAPSSTCSFPCQPGYRKQIQMAEIGNCCWSCLRCDDSEYLVNETTCMPCAPGEWSNEDRTDCISLEVEYLRVNSLEACLVMTCAVLGILASLTTISIFLLYNSTPIVKSTTRELSYIILTGALLCYGTTFIIVLKPTAATCLLLRVIPGFSFALMYGSLLTKTNRIARILAGSKKRILTKKPKFLSITSQVVITFLLIGIECVIILAMLIYQPPDARHDYSRHKRVFLICNTSTIAFLAPFAFDLILIILCTIYAVKTRNLPENFNEAKFIGFTMYTTCIIWIAFLTIYFGSDSKSITMCFCFSLSATVILVFLFFPKLYIILFQPHKNVRSSFATSKVVRCHFGATPKPDDGAKFSKFSFGSRAAHSTESPGLRTKTGSPFHKSSADTLTGYKAAVANLPVNELSPHARRHSSIHSQRKSSMAPNQTGSPGYGSPISEMPYGIIPISENMYIPNGMVLDGMPTTSQFLNVANSKGTRRVHSFKEPKSRQLSIVEESSQAAGLPASPCQGGFELSVDEISTEAYSSVGRMLRGGMEPSLSATTAAVNSILKKTNVHFDSTVDHRFVNTGVQTGHELLEDLLRGWWLNPENTGMKQEKAEKHHLNPSDKGSHHHSGFLSLGKWKSRRVSCDQNPMKRSSVCEDGKPRGVAALLAMTPGMNIPVDKHANNSTSSGEEDGANESLRRGSNAGSSGVVTSVSNLPSVHETKNNLRLATDSPNTILERKRKTVSVIETQAGTIQPIEECSESDTQDGSSSTVLEPQLPKFTVTDTELESKAAESLAEARLIDRKSVQKQSSTDLDALSFASGSSRTNERWTSLQNLGVVRSNRGRTAVNKLLNVINVAGRRRHSMPVAAQVVSICSNDDPIDLRISKTSLTGEPIENNLVHNLRRKSSNLSSDDKSQISERSDLWTTRSKKSSEYQHDIEDSIANSTNDNSNPHDMDTATSGLGSTVIYSVNSESELTPISMLLEEETPSSEYVTCEDNRQSEVQNVERDTAIRSNESNDNYNSWTGQFRKHAESLIRRQEPNNVNTEDALAEPQPYSSTQTGFKSNLTENITRLSDENSTSNNNEVLISNTATESSARQCTSKLDNRTIPTICYQQSSSSVDSTSGDQHKISDRRKARSSEKNKQIKDMLEETIGIEIDLDSESTML